MIRETLGGHQTDASHHFPVTRSKRLMKAEENQIELSTEHITTSLESLLQSYYSTPRM